MKCLVNNIDICIRFAQLILVKVMNITSNLESYPDYQSYSVLWNSKRDLVILPEIMIFFL